MQKTIKKSSLATHTIFALILTLTIISVSVVFTLAFRPLYYLDISALDIPGQSGYTKEKIRENYDVLIDYNLSFGSDSLEFPSLAMSEPGRIHFEEVRDIFHIFKYMAIAGAVLSIGGIVFFVRKREYLYLKLTSILAVALPAALGLLVALNWDWAFVAFHHLAFDNDYWIFDPLTDPVITILPDTFFLHCALMILGCVALGSVICGLAYRRQKA
ncbi:MAG: TIGR01906 family membrane protein [Lachnospiraceae bacterium]|jgi:integral membrane protein (TIGR01906 family)|nr:TIGR01906 family membrane protein [Lachnospiraceae bacterium]